MEETRTYSKGDWIVHSHHGIGRIKGVEKKNISGEETRYFRIKTTDSVFWMPEEKMDSEALRPLSTPDEIQQALAILQNPPGEMSSNYKIRQLRIQKAQSLNSPNAMARIIRDLRAYRRKAGALNSSERNAFRALKQHLVEEWAIVAGIDRKQATQNLENLLNLHSEAEE